MDYVSKFAVFIFSVFVVPQSFCETISLCCQKGIKKELLNELIRECAQDKNRQCVKRILDKFQKYNLKLDLDEERELFQAGLENELYNTDRNENGDYLKKIIKVKPKQLNSILENQKFLALLKNKNTESKTLENLAIKMGQDGIALSVEVQVQMQRNIAFAKDKEDKNTKRNLYDKLYKKNCRFYVTHLREYLEG